MHKQTLPLISSALLLTCMLVTTGTALAQADGNGDSRAAVSTPASPVSTAAGQPIVQNDAKGRVITPTPTVSDTTSSVTQPSAQTPSPATALPAIRQFKAPVAMVHRLHRITELPALQLSLALVNFVGDLDPSQDTGDAYAILPLASESLIEVYDLHYDGHSLTPSSTPVVRRQMGNNEAYVLRVPSYGGVPVQAVCVTARGMKHCWNPGYDDFDGDFIRWSATKGLK